jgi:hypothetical protein
MEQQMSEETIVIKCQHCGDMHKYRLNIVRSPYLYGTSGNTKRVTRLFTCPKENKDFQSVLEMKEDDRGTITKVEVVGIEEN